ncbi:16S rRNA (adenine(1518)-N(6)/adenine(1519)-N(6))-dimethyltransferase RsmA [Methylococcus sp. ANG]|uniref:16S rRNA (adenine(1518)-N(6)/adenine(1519)-N(6))- dimethyltransferase RsmA n=1 Tax=unclassified Methylococcus TaxID=2618889 RepID=UPI001C52D21C|nr:16S rRNA (adenine(1518)-N(6)/adenine(1519)-N(6))-dimethyltransferase RsmA [Methylococcus sp. Mc7]QXP84594.1 16S rRNA (adenine(1518)-N(6)/adenine(1519)-N(6))-dimethyltransferase RsmA [Methylococcus sp. Mc7]
MMHVPRKRFGQNFLRDPGVIREIVAAIGPGPSDRLVEIGPGEGVLTRELLQSGAYLDVIELDRDLVAALKQRFAGAERLRIHEGDALKFDLRTIARDARLRVVGNLPYNISTPLMFRLFDQLDAIEDMHFMLQKEVVDRLCAGPGDGNYGRLSVMAALYCEAQHLFDVGPECFYPRPKVVSAVVRLVPHAGPPDADRVKRVSAVVAAAFGQRRKTLRNALKGLLDETAMARAGIDPGARAEELSLDDYVGLSRQLSP